MPALQLTAIAVLVLVNGFFVAAEFALVSLRRGELDGAAARTRLARKQHGRLDEYLAACQVGITIASLALGALGEPAIAHLLEPVLESTILVHAAAVIASIGALLIMTALHITIGEQAPKSFAIGSAGKVARFCALPLEIFHRGLRPLVLILNGASNALVRLFGGTPAGSHTQDASLEELRQLIGGLSADGHLDRAETQILQGVFTLDEQRASDVMTPRTRLTTVREGQTVREALESTRERGHSRFPLLSPDGALLGIVYLRELAEALLDDEGDRRVESLRHDPVVVPPTVALDVLLATLQQRRASLAFVVDEYGGLDGVVSIEDILEEVVGEIWDEDDVSTEFRLLADGRMVVRGDMALRDLAEHGLAFERPPTASTIAGAVTGLLGRLARPGDRVHLGNARVRVLSIEGGRVKRVLLEL